MISGTWDCRLRLDVARRDALAQSRLQLQVLLLEEASFLPLQCAVLGAGLRGGCSVDECVTHRRLVTHVQRSWPLRVLGVDGFFVVTTLTLLPVHLGHHASERMLVTVNVLRRGHVGELACTYLCSGGFNARHTNEARRGLLAQWHRTIRVSIDIATAFARGL